MFKLSQIPKVVLQKRFLIEFILKKQKGPKHVAKVLESKTKPSVKARNKNRANFLFSCLEKTPSSV